MFVMDLRVKTLEIQVNCSELQTVYVPHSLCVCSDTEDQTTIAKVPAHA